MEARAELVIGQLTVDFQRRMTELHINYAELARRLGLSRARVSELFSGRQNPTVGTLMKVAEALGCYLRIDLEPLDLPGSQKPATRYSGTARRSRSPVLRVSLQESAVPTKYRRR